MIGEPGSGQVVVLSYDYWRRRFGARSDIVDQTDPRQRPADDHRRRSRRRDFTGRRSGDRPRIYVPLSMREAIVPRWKGLDDRRSYWAYLFARLKPGISRSKQARAASTRNTARSSPRSIVPLQQGMRPSMLAQFGEMQMQLEPGARGQSRTPDEARQPLTLLFGVTAIVLLICCANVANLLLGRAARRVDGNGRAPLDRRGPQTHHRPAARPNRCSSAMGGHRRASRRRGGP